MQGGGGGGGGRGGAPPPPPPRDDLRFSNATGILQKKKKLWFIGVEVEQETPLRGVRILNAIAQCDHVSSHFGLTNKVT